MRGTAVAVGAAQAASGSELASWWPLAILLGGYAAIAAGLFALGRGSAIERIPSGIVRLTGMPGWAVAGGGTALYGLMVAGQGFYSDVAWHVALGRDKVLFTAPHTGIIVGLGMIFVASAVGVTAATVEGVATRLRLGALRIPWSMGLLALLGGSAVAGFPLDDVWHRRYGIDVTMWSPTHMLMILGASFTGLAVWLVLAEAGVSPRASAWARAAHVLTGALVILGLAASQGEFDFGVPQFQQVFHPLLVTLTGAFALVAIRLVHGRGWALGIAAGVALVETTVLVDRDPVATRPGGLYVAAALTVEAVAWWVGTDRRLRFALLAGLGVGTFGLAGEWAWNQGAHQPWTSHLVPDALVLSLVVALGGAVLGVAFGDAVATGAEAGSEVGGERHAAAGADGAADGAASAGAATGPAPGAAPAAGGARAPAIRPAVLAAAGVAVLLALALPMPRRVGAVGADVTLERSGDARALVHVRLTPADAAEDARWFQAMSWQGGGLVLAEMDRVGPGEYVSDRPLPITGRAKTVLRLHRGGEMMAVPIYLPADPEIGAPEVPPVDRSARFEAEQAFLMRERRGGSPWLARAVYTLLTLVAVAWIGAFVAVATRVRAGAAPATPVGVSAPRRPPVRPHPTPRT